MKKYAAEVFLLLCFISIFWTCFPRLSDATFWDESKVYFKPLFSLYAGWMTFFSEPLTLYHRPPGLHLLYLPFLHLFGPRLEVVRVLNVIYFSLSIYFFFRSLAERNLTQAMVIVAFFLSLPIVQVYEVQYTGEPQLFLLYSLCIFLLTFHPKNSAALFFLGVYAGLSREPSLALTPAILAYLVIEGERSKKKLLFSSLGPVVGFSIYTFFVYAKTGEFFHHLTIDQGHIDLFRDLKSRGMKIWQNLLVPYRLIPLLLTSMIAVPFALRKIKLTGLMGFSLSLSTAYVFVFSSHAIGIPRYFWAVVPFILYILAFSLEPWFTANFRRWVLGGVIIIPSLLIGEPGVEERPPFYHHNGYQDTSLYREILGLHVKVVGDLKRTVPPNLVVMTSWPFTEILKSDYMGYGASSNYKIIHEREEGSLPDAILYTDYPRQLDWDAIAEILRQGPYVEKEYAFNEYRLRLFIKRN